MESWRDFSELRDILVLPHPITSLPCHLLLSLSCSSEICSSIPATQDSCFWFWHQQGQSELGFCDSLLRQWDEEWSLWQLSWRVAVQHAWPDWLTLIFDFCFSIFPLVGCTYHRESYFPTLQSEEVCWFFKAPCLESIRRFSFSGLFPDDKYRWAMFWGWAMPEREFSFSGLPFPSFWLIVPRCFWLHSDHVFLSSIFELDWQCQESYWE